MASDEILSDCRLPQLSSAKCGNGTYICRMMYTTEIFRYLCGKKHPALYLHMLNSKKKEDNDS